MTVGIEGRTLSRVLGLSNLPPGYCLPFDLSGTSDTPALEVGLAPFCCADETVAGARACAAVPCAAVGAAASGDPDGGAIHARF